MAEVLARLDEVRPERQVFTLQYALCDSPGDMALVEYLSGRAEVNRNPQPGVLTNTGYMCSVAYARSKASVPTGSFSRSISSLDRFALAERLIAEAQATASLATVDDLFRLLDQVALRPSFQGLARWALRREPPTQTQWTTVFDPQLRRVHWRAQGSLSTWTCELTRLDFDGRQPARAIDVRTPGGGGASSRLYPFEVEDNRRPVEASFRPLGSTFPAPAREALATYPETFDCVSTRSIDETHLKEIPDQ